MAESMRTAGEAVEAGVTARADVRLRVPDRAQVKMRVGCDETTS